jgi:N-acetylglucosaminyl-diphospho-decaprenol L-rhamnosyltransferase
MTAQTASPSEPPPAPRLGPADARIVVVTYNPGETLDSFLASLECATTSLAVEVVMVDNGSSDGAPQAVAKAGRARLIETGRNLGYGAAANIGARDSDAPWLVICNPDLEWHPGALDALVTAVDRWPAAGAFGPAILESDGSVYPSARALPSLRTGVGHALFARLWPGNPWTRRYRGSTDGRERTTGWLSGSCVAVRRRAFEAIGGFDPGYFMFFEDVDLGHRLRLAGYASVYVPSAAVTHLGGHSWRARPEPMIAAHHESAGLYLSRRYPRWYQAPIRIALRAGLDLRRRVELRRAGRG